MLEFCCAVSEKNNLIIFYGSENDTSFYVVSADGINTV